MSAGPKTIRPDALAAEAVQLMQVHKIQGLLVVGDSGELEGVLNFHDLLGAGVV
jgi:arabinose-5-phosphate isomerase